MLDSDADKLRSRLDKAFPEKSVEDSLIGFIEKLVDIELGNEKLLIALAGALGKINGKVDLIYTTLANHINDTKFN